ncbi:hypothetical protein ABK040_013687 [Willaertia magna]
MKATRLPEQDFIEFSTLEEVAKERVVINKLYKLNENHTNLSELSNNLKVTTATYNPSFKIVYISKCIELNYNKKSNCLITGCTLKELKLDQVEHNNSYNSPLNNYINTKAYVNRKIPIYFLLEERLANDHYHYLVYVKNYRTRSNLNVKKQNDDMYLLMNDRDNYKQLTNKDLLIDVKSEILPNNNNITVNDDGKRIRVDSSSDMNKKQKNNSNNPFYQAILGLLGDSEKTDWNLINGMISMLENAANNHLESYRKTGK